MSKEVVYFELNNWFAGDHYPAEEPFLSWMKDDLKQQFMDKEWCKDNKICVLFQLLDMSFNYLITAPKSWVDKNCPKLLTEYAKFLRYPDTEDGIYTPPTGRTGEYFLEYNEDNIGFHEGPDY